MQQVVACNSILSLNSDIFLETSATISWRYNRLKPILVHMIAHVLKFDLLPQFDSRHRNFAAAVSSALSDVVARQTNLMSDVYCQRRWIGFSTQCRKFYIVMPTVISHAIYRSLIYIFIHFIERNKMFNAVGIKGNISHSSRVIKVGRVSDLHVRVDNVLIPRSVKSLLCTLSNNRHALFVTADRPASFRRAM